ncbi:ATP-binding protein [Antrihabitans sp. YC2-6]|uniref:AAA family ATPase n=1 Tax=Antrihabitans sp. YC2-6 TaxID=2799498 RepID=UPI0018F4F511|nr:ATP-binding protein [Antrihabitans sp. YC2-6]MBJ8343170.1 ATP-binding protein [Antrihabitans sp. YC2-6]
MSTPTLNVTDLRAALDGESSCVRRTLDVLGEILSGTKEDRLTDETFAAHHLGARHSELVAEMVKLSATSTLATAATIVELIELHHPAVGPGDDSDPPEWRRLEIDDVSFSLPKTLSLFFPAHTLGSAATVVRLIGADVYRGPALFVYAAPPDREIARAVFDSITATAKTKNLLRGRALLASCNDGLQLDITELAPRDRASLCVPQQVWDEIDVNVASLTSRAELMRELGLGTRRGILLAGPPGVGKSAISAIVATELLGEFTVIFVDARAASYVLRAVFEECKELGPTVVVLEDIDLYIGDRSAGTGGAGLAEFLAVMDGSQRYDDVLTLASTNDPAALDKAATRASRFDAIIHLDYPDIAGRAEILRRLLGNLHCAAEIDTRAVAAGIGVDVSGADLREIVRRAVLAHGSDLTTGRLRDVIAQGRWKPEPLVGNYL